MTQSAGVRHFLVFLSTFVVLIAGVIAVTSRLVLDLRARPFNFAAMKDSEIMLPARITRRQEAELKVGYAEHFRPSVIGLFGNHQVQYFDSDAFGSARFAIPVRYGEVGDRRDLFFNHWFADLTLADLLDYLSYLESIDRLPEQMIVVGITTPNNDNGMHILGRSWHLPPDLRYFAEKQLSARQVFDLAGQWLESAIFAVRYYTDYMSVLAAISQSGERIKAQETTQCRGASRTPPTERRGPLASLPLPGTIVNLFAEPDPFAFCFEPRGSFRRDGASAVDRRSDPIVVLDENPLNAKSTALHPGDEVEIARIMRAIDAIGRRTRRQVVFLIPPVYETDRRGPSDAIFSAALELVADLNVIDHRHIHKEKENFWEYDHPNRRYYEIVADTLIGRYLRATSAEGRH